MRAGNVWPRSRRFFLPVAVVAVATACDGPVEASTAPCELVAPASLERLNPYALAGSYELALVAAYGPMAGAETSVRLVLRPQEPGLRDVLDFGGEPIPGATQALVGTLSKGLEEVGAWVWGDVGSEDPEAPGVSFLVIRPGNPGGGHTRIIMRIGSEANGRGRVVFDEVYTVLSLQRVTSDGLFGVWASASRTDQAGGYFCALR